MSFEHGFVLLTSGGSTPMFRHITSAAVTVRNRSRMRQSGISDALRARGIPFVLCRLLFQCVMYGDSSSTQSSASACSKAPWRGPSPSMSAVSIVTLDTLAFALAFTLASNTSDAAASCSLSNLFTFSMVNGPGACSGSVMRSAHPTAPVVEWPQPSYSRRTSPSTP